MSRYLDMLKTEKEPDAEPTKLTQPGFVSSVSSPNGRFLGLERGCVGSVSTPNGHFQEIDGGSVSSVSSPNWRFQENGAHHLPPHQAEVVAMLRQDPAMRYAFTSRSHGESVIVTLAIRDVAVADLSIPRSKYDGFEFMKLVQEVAG